MGLLVWGIYGHSQLQLGWAVVLRIYSINEDENECSIKVWKIKWWMGRYGSATPKPHVGWSNLATIGKLYNGKVAKRTRKVMKEKASTTRTYVNSQGKRCWVGTRHLKASQSLGLLCWVEFVFFQCYMRLHLVCSVFVDGHSEALSSKIWFQSAQDQHGVREDKSRSIRGFRE